eukprot:COSAG02_NODE_66174_length_256_cov_0.656051_1_plen_24_part_10
MQHMWEVEMSAVHRSHTRQSVLMI